MGFFCENCSPVRSFCKFTARAAAGQIAPFATRPCPGLVAPRGALVAPRGGTLPPVGAHARTWCFVDIFVSLHDQIYLNRSARHWFCYFFMCARMRTRGFFRRIPFSETWQDFVSFSCLGKILCCRLRLFTLHGLCARAHARTWCFVDIFVSLHDQILLTYLCHSLFMRARMRIRGVCLYMSCCCLDLVVWLPFLGPSWASLGSS